MLLVMVSGTILWPSFEDTQDCVTPISKGWSLLENGPIFGGGRPTYTDYDITLAVSVSDHGAKGDGYIDGTIALQTVFDKVRSKVSLSLPWDLR